MNLFQRGNFTLHSGKQSDFKIECDALTDDDWEGIAQEIAKRVKFRAVYGVPTGGLKLQKALEKYATKGDPELPPTLPILIVDDVLTTGKSILEFAQNLGAEGVWRIRGFVVFAREECHTEWIDALFKMY